MIEGKNIVYFSNDFSPDNKVSSSHIFRILAESNRVLYVESGGLRAPRANARDFRRLAEKVYKWLQGERKVFDNVFVYTILLIPFHHIKTVRLFNKWFVRTCLRRVMRRSGFTDPVLWLISPHMEYVVGYLGENFSVYYCADNFSEFPGVNRNAVKEMEINLLKKASVVFVTAKSLLSDRIKYNPNTFYSPHAVNFAHFNKACKESTKIPEEIQTNKRKKVGFFGLVEEWFDLSLLESAAKELPQLDFIIIGRVAVDVERFSNIKNVYFLGKREFNDLPGYLEGFDVCIIPFKVNEVTKHVNPIKLKEYLSAGKPVISTWMQELEFYDGYVYVANTKEEFVAHIRTALEQDNEELRLKRISLVAGDSWELQLEKVSKHIGDVLLQNTSLHK